MTAVTMGTVPEKVQDGSHSALEGVTYPELVETVAQMKAQDPRIVFDSLRPIGDELWNFIDGERTVEEIAEAVCIEFGFELDPVHFNPFFVGMLNRGLIRLDSANP